MPQQIECGRLPQLPARPRITKKYRALTFAAYRMVVLGVSLSALFRVSIRAASIDDPRNSAAVAIRLYNYSSARPADVIGMQTEATRIFKAAAIETRWIQCSPIPAADPTPAQCGKAADDTTVFLLLVNDPELLGSTSGTARVKVGYTLGLATHRDFPELSCGQILGYVAAHEIGHVFLGPNAHSAAGIMRPTFRRCDLSEMGRGHLLFLPQQSRLLRSKVLSLSSPPERGQMQSEAHLPAPRLLRTFFQLPRE